MSHAALPNTEWTEVPLPTATLQQWSAELIPPGDVWFIDESLADVCLSICTVMSRGDYLTHSEFHDIRYANAYLHWQISPDITRVVIADPTWIGSLDHDDHQRLLRQQIALKRGLVFPRAHFDELPEVLQTNTIGDRIVIGHATWNALSEPVQLEALRREQRVWDDRDCLPVPNGASETVQVLANRFSPQENGGNCFATTAACATNQASMANHWMTEPFHDVLTRIGYAPVDTSTARAGDAVTFSLEGRAIHAAFCLGRDRFLNRNGQSRFNPVRVVDWASVDRDWPETELSIYRITHPSDGAT